MSLILLLFLWLGQSQQRPAESQAPANAQQHGSPSVSSPSPSQDAGQAGNQSQQRQDNATRWSDPIVLLQLLLFVAVAVQAGIYVWQAILMRRTLGVLGKQAKSFKDQAVTMQKQFELETANMVIQREAMASQLKAMQEQAKIMDKTLVFGTRAYVGIEKLVADYRARKIHLYIKNVGKVPANSIQVMLELRVQILRTLLPLTQPPTGWGAVGYDPDCWGMTVPFLHAYGKRTKLFPGQTLDVITFIEPYHLSRSEIMLVEQGEGVRIRIRGEVRYSDGFHKDKVTHYDFWYLGGEWVPQQLDDPVGQYSDQYKPDSDYEPS